jgi:hypothetical protein
MTKWYYKDAEREIGPLDGPVLKQLADSGVLSPSTAVRTEDMRNWVPADRIGGLFGKSTAPAVTPTTAKSTAGAEATADLSDFKHATPPEQPAGMGERLFSMLKTATALAAKHAQLKTLQWDLHRADELTGNTAHAGQIGRQTCADLYNRITAVDEDLAAKRRAEPTPSSESTTDKATRLAYEATKKVAIESLLSQRTKYLRELGERLRTAGETGNSPALVDALKQARRADVRVEAMKAEIAALSAQSPPLVKRLLLVAATAVVLLTGYWAYGLVASWTHHAATVTGAQAGSAQFQAQLAEMQRKRELEAAERAARQKLETEKSALAAAEFQRQRESEAAELDFRRKQAAEKAALDLERRKFEAEKQAKEAELAKQQGDSARRMQSAVSEATALVERRHLADELLGKIVLDPAKGVQPSKTLMQRFKATVELRGPKYLDIAELHAKRNWLGLINLVSNNAFLDLPDAQTIENAFQTLGQYNFTMLVRTTLVVPNRGSNIPSLFLISFPLQFGRTYGEAVVASNRWERHPDGIGYFHPWKPSDGYSIVVLALPNVVHGSVRQVNTEVRQKFEVLQTKLKLGEIDETTVQLESAMMLSRVREQVSAWAANQ